MTEDAHYKHMGKFYLPRVALEQVDIWGLFASMSFIPVRAEVLYYNDEIEYIGMSPMFEPLEDGEMIPTYKVVYEIPAAKHASPKLTVTRKSRINMN